MTSLALRLTDVSFRYPEAERDTLADVTAAVEAREFVGVLGPNGGGKTTLLKLLLGLERPHAGTLEVLGTTPKLARPRVGYVPQIQTVDASMPADVLDVVLLGRLRRGLWGPRWSREDREAALFALERVQSAELAQRPWTALSGGQRQRVLIARALASDSQLLLLDEPTTGVDMHKEHVLLHLLQEINEHLPIVMVTHDLALVRSHADGALWVDRCVRRLPIEDLTIPVVEGLLHSRADGTPCRGLEKGEIEGTT